MALGWFLVVESDEHTADVLSRTCRAFRSVLTMSSTAAALELIRQKRRWAGVITEIDFPGGSSGFEVVKAARGLSPLLPVLVVTSNNTPQTINQAHSLRAELLCKPTSRQAVRTFLWRAVALERVGSERISSVIESMIRRSHLTPREAEILAAAVGGVQRKTLADELGTTENTLKTQVRTLLKKTGHASLDELTRPIMQEALTGGLASGWQDDETRPASGAFTIRPSALAKASGEE